MPGYFSCATLAFCLVSLLQLHSGECCSAGVRSMLTRSSNEPPVPNPDQIVTKSTVTRISNVATAAGDVQPQQVLQPMSDSDAKNLVKVATRNAFKENNPNVIEVQRQPQQPMAGTMEEADRFYNIHQLNVKIRQAASEKSKAEKVDVQNQPRSPPMTEAEADMRVRNNMASGVWQRHDTPNKKIDNSNKPQLMKDTEAVSNFHTAHGKAVLRHHSTDKGTRDSGQPISARTQAYKPGY